MSASINKATLMGHLGADPEVRSFQNGGKVCTLRIATTEKWKDRDGNKQERAEWHTVSIFNEGLVTVAERYLKKGSKVYVEGTLQTRKWKDQSGNDRYSTEIVLRGYSASLLMLDNRSGNSGQSGGSSQQGQQQGALQDHGGYGDDMDDDIPF